MFLEQTEQFIICAWLEIQIQKCLFQQATLSQGKLKNNKKWENMGKQEVSLHRDSAGMINGAHTLHAWTIWKTKLPAGTCFLFSPAVHKTQKAAQVPQSSWQPCMRRGLICFMKPLWDFSAPTADQTRNRSEMQTVRWRQPLSSHPSSAKCHSADVRVVHLWSITH